MGLKNTRKGQDCSNAGGEVQDVLQLELSGDISVKSILVLKSQLIDYTKSAKKLRIKISENTKLDVSSIQLLKALKNTY